LWICVCKAGFFYHLFSKTNTVIFVWPYIIVNPQFITLPFLIEFNI